MSGEHESDVGEPIGHKSEDDENVIDDLMNDMGKNWDNVRDFLAEVDIFQHLTDEERNKLAMNMMSVKFNYGDRILVEGEEGNSFFIITKGNVIVRKKDVSNPFQTLGARDYFGGIALQSDQANHASVIAQGFVECVEMKKSFFKESVEPSGVAQPLPKFWLRH